MSKPLPSPVVRFVVRFVVLYGLLIAPWPGWNARYGAWINTLGNTVFPLRPGRWIVRFEPIARTPARPLDTRITVANREKLAPNGTGPAVMLDLDARGVGWVPTAVLISLTLATPLPWFRRIRALLAGLAGIHAFILFSIGMYVLSGCDGRADLSLVALPPFWKTIVDALNETLVTQMGPGFVFAVLLWILATFRRTDWRLLAAALEKNAPDPDRPGEA